MAKSKIQITAGDVFNNWTVLSEEACGQYFLCRCICGTERSVKKGNLGRVLGCGCVRKPYKKRNATPKTKNKPITVSIAKQTSPKKDAPQAVPYSERQKSAREKLEERLDDYRLERELSELWAA